MLSQLVTGNARPFRAFPRERVGKKRGRRAEGQPPVGEGASDGGENKQPAAGKRHEGCLQDEWLALGRRLLPSLPAKCGAKGGRARV